MTTDGLQTSNPADSRFSNQSMTMNYRRIHNMNVASPGGLASETLRWAPHCV